MPCPFCALLLEGARRCLFFFLRVLPLFPSARRFSLFLPPIGGIVSAELNDDDAAAAPCGREQNKKAGTPAGGEQACPKIKGEAIYIGNM